MVHVLADDGAVQVKEVEPVEEGDDAATDAAVDADGDTDMERGTKRHHSASNDADSNARRRKKKKKMPGPPLPKNALMQLNEIKPGLVYNLVSQSGGTIF